MSEADLNRIALLKWFETYQGATFSLAANANPQAIAFDGSSLWVANSGNYTVTKVRASDGAASSWDVGQVPMGIAFDGANIWVANSEDDTLSKL